ncbi:MAG: hypothetical protein ABIE07_06735 [Candidatus Zixiibacteriota bacterium]
MEKTLFTICAVLCMTLPGFAVEPQSLDEAKTLSNQTGKPLLLEFYRDD